jgi:membrane protein
MIMLLVISISGVVLGEEARGAIVQKIGGLVGQDGAAAIRSTGASIPGSENRTLAFNLAD